MGGAPRVHNELRLDELRIGESEQLGNGTASVDSQSGQYRLAHQGGLDDIGNRALAGQNSRSTRRLSSGIGSSLIASVGLQKSGGRTGG